MRNHRFGLVIALILILTTGLALAADQKTWNYMPSAETGTQIFRAEHPTWDGRGVAVAIFDTGVDAFAPGLLETSTGQTKLIDVRDFSTEGDFETAVAERDASGTEAAPVFRHRRRPAPARRGKTARASGRGRHRLHRRDRRTPVPEQPERVRT